MSKASWRGYMAHRVADLLGCGYFEAYDVVVCLGKSGFPEEAARERAAEYGVGCYECPVCGRWHLRHEREGDGK